MTRKPSAKKKAKMRLITPWLPPPENGKGQEPSKPGEPMVRHLFAFSEDRTMRCGFATACCDCGLTHFETFEIFRNPKKPEWWLVARSYRMNTETENRRRLKKHAFREVRK